MAFAFSRRATLTTLDEIKRETECNHRALDAKLEQLRAEFGGRFALMRKGVIVDWFASDVEALRQGRARYSDRLYSIHRVRRTTQRSPVVNSPATG